MWTNFFNRVAYVVGYDVVSAYEIENNVLRAGMSKPTSYVSKMGVNLGSINTHVFPHLELKHGDFRFNFCINTGTKSMPAVIPIYRAAELDSQLDRATTMMLRSHVEVDPLRRSVVLPRVCNVYLSDFSPRNTANPSPKDCLRVIVYYLAEPQRSSLMRMLTDEGKGHITVRFHKMIYRGSGLALMTPSGEDEDGE
jgi:hypothetical protein